MSIRDQIMQASDITTEKVHVPEWGVDVYLRTMTGTERDYFEQTAFGGSDKEQKRRQIRATMVAFTMVVGPDVNAERVFDPHKEAEIKQLGGKSAKALDRLFARAQKMNGVTEDDIEDLAGNSEAEDGADSSSDSPES